jgi:hypothetical protein
MRPVPGKSKRAALCVVLLLLLLAGLLFLALLPDGLGGTRIGGVSLLWWYGSVGAPVLAWIVAVALGGPPVALDEQPSDRA